MGSRFWPVLPSCSKMICARTERVMSSPLLASIDDEIVARLDHFSQVVQSHVGARARIVEAPVGVFLYRDGLLFAGHCPIPCGQWPDDCYELIQDEPCSEKFGKPRSRKEITEFLKKFRRHLSRPPPPRAWLADHVAHGADFWRGLDLHSTKRPSRPPRMRLDHAVGEMLKLPRKSPTKPNGRGGFPEEPACRPML